MFKALLPVPQQGPVLSENRPSLDLLQSLARIIPETDQMLLICQDTTQILADLHQIETESLLAEDD
jgi:hypothetical protein